MSFDIPWSDLKFDRDGLIPAVIQDINTKKVLMLAYMNEQSLQQTIETGETWFWSRSRQRLWNKGETSGNKQYVKMISYDCDGDTLLIQVDQYGPACHTGANTCFYQSIKTIAPNRRTDTQESQQNSSDVEPSLAILRLLEERINARKEEMPLGSYTTYLFQQGLDKMLKKVGEEASELIIAAKNGSNQELRAEVADLFYHVLVVLSQQNLPLDQVLLELEKRHR